MSILEIHMCDIKPTIYFYSATDKCGQVTSKQYSQIVNCILFYIFCSTLKIEMTL